MNELINHRDTEDTENPILIFKFFMLQQILMIEVWFTWRKIIHINAILNNELVAKIILRCIFEGGVWNIAKNL
jgi:hypothetical protein